MRGRCVSLANWVPHTIWGRGGSKDSFEAQCSEGPGAPSIWV